VGASYGANHARLQALKQRFDPDNLFRMNLNIAPAGMNLNIAPAGAGQGA
jgi:Berberine and berberine like